MSISVKTFYASLLALTYLLPISVNAQEQVTQIQEASLGQPVIESTQVPQEPKSLSEQLLQRIAIRNPEVVPDAVEPVFFTKSEINLVRDARKGLVTRAPTPSELNNSDAPIPMGPRDIKLGGIVYVAKDDWTIWLNNMQVKPKAIPPEVLDLNVYKEYIEIEWFDAFTNQIFPIRLRPNQTFNIDSRIFLPG